MFLHIYAKGSTNIKNATSLCELQFHWWVEIIKSHKIPKIFDWSCANMYFAHLSCEPELVKCFIQSPACWDLNFQLNFLVEFPVSFHPAGMNGGFCISLSRNWTVFWGESLEGFSFVLPVPFQRSCQSHFCWDAVLGMKSSWEMKPVQNKWH